MSGATTIEVSPADLKEAKRRGSAVAAFVEACITSESNGKNDPGFNGFLDAIRMRDLRRYVEAVHQLVGIYGQKSVAQSCERGLQERYADALAGWQDRQGIGGEDDPAVVLFGAELASAHEYCMRGL
jgi:hypothetical protein